MPCAGTRSWRWWLRGMDPTLPGQLLQVEETITGHPQTGTCKAETPFAPFSCPPSPPKACFAMADLSPAWEARGIQEAHQEFRCQKGQPGALPWL